MAAPLPDSVCTLSREMHDMTSNRTAPNIGPPRLGFTLVELLVVVAIIALLISILLPSLNRAREQAKTVVCGAHMRQLGTSIVYYSDEHNGALVWIPGKAPKFTGGPYSQWQMIVHLWPYMKSIDLYKCPSAKGINSVQSLFGKDDASLGGGSGTAPRTNSYYFVKAKDSWYIQNVYQKGLFPEHDPYKLPSTQSEFQDLYTEYWFNDYSTAGTDGQGNPIAVKDGAGHTYPKMNGGRVGQIPFPQYTVPFTEYGYFSQDDEEYRHNKKMHLAYLDTHVELLSRQQFFDPRQPNLVAGKNMNLPPASSVPFKDYDPYGNRCFWVWGLSKDGANIGPQ